MQTTPLDLLDDGQDTEESKQRLADLLKKIVKVTSIELSTVIYP